MTKKRTSWQWSRADLLFDPENCMLWFIRGQTGRSTLRQKITVWKAWLMSNLPDNWAHPDVMFTPLQDVITAPLRSLRSTSWFCDLYIRLFLLPVWEGQPTTSSQTGCTCVALAANWLMTCKNSPMPPHRKTYIHIHQGPGPWVRLPRH